MTTARRTADDRQPKYLRIHGALQDRITSGQWPAGSPLPSQRELAGEFSVSIMTLRQALQLLGQTWVGDAARLASCYGRNDELQLAFNFPFAFAEFSADALATVVSETLAALPSGACPVWMAPGSPHPAWLPFPDARAPEVAQQRADTSSVLWLCKQLIALRRAEMGAGVADLEFLPTAGGLMAYRVDGLLVAANLSGQQAAIPVQAGEVLLASSPPSPDGGDQGVLGPWEGIVARWSAVIRTRGQSVDAGFTV